MLHSADFPHPERGSLPRRSASFGYVEDRPDVRVSDWILAGITVAAVLFNPLLAALNAQFLDVSVTHVMLAEAFILLTAAGAILASGIREEDFPSICLGAVFLAISLFVSIVNEAIFPDALRNAAIIALFSMLGSRMSFATLKNTVTLLSALILATLALEAFATEVYSTWFGPAAYFEATRGLENPSHNDTGLFANTLRPADRFSFGILDHRASSLFLEQVSLANYAIVVMVLLIAFWRRLSPAERTFQVIAVIAILLTTDSRAGLILCLAGIIGYFVFPLLPRLANVAIFPAILAIGWWFAEKPGAPLDDDIIGRLSLTTRTLGDIDLAALWGFEVFAAKDFVDSGYTYVIYSSTILGLIALWLFVSIYLPQANKYQKRCAYMASLVFASSLLVAGTSIFTIKVAALFWLILGAVQRWPFDDEASAEQAEPTVVAGRRVPERRLRLTAPR